MGRFWILLISNENCFDDSFIEVAETSAKVLYITSENIHHNGKANRKCAYTDSSTTGSSLDKKVHDLTFHRQRA
jgi:hypothetical protein